jgi:hypothetical protein
MTDQIILSPTMAVEEFDKWNTDFKSKGVSDEDLKFFGWDLDEHSISSETKFYQQFHHSYRQHIHPVYKAPNKQIIYLKHMIEGQTSDINALQTEVKSVHLLANQQQDQISILQEQSKSWQLLIAQQQNQMNDLLIELSKIQNRS